MRPCHCPESRVVPLLRSSGTRHGFSLFLAILSVGLGANAYGEAYDYKPKQKFVVLAKKGYFGMLEIKPEVSVNKSGFVGFIGKVNSPEQPPRQIDHLFHIDIPNLQGFDNNPGITSILASEFGPSLTVNDKNELFTRRVSQVSSLSGPITFCDLDRWHLTDKYRTSLITARPRIVGLEDARFESFSTACAQNDSGDWAAVGQNFVKSPGIHIAIADQFGILSTHINSPVPPVSFMMSNRVGPNFHRARLVVSWEEPAGDFISLLNVPGIVPETRIAGPENGFSEVGARPGISRDGSLIVFSGVGTADPNLPAAPGVFALVYPSKLVRLAGVSGNQQLDPGEYFDDNNDATPRDGKFTDTGAGQDIGCLTGFDMASQVAVNNGGYVAFVAFRAGKKALFFTRVDAVAGTGGDPFCLLTVGDKIDGLGGVVADFRLSDSLGDRGAPGDLVFWVRTSTGDHAIVTTRPRHKPLIFVPGLAATNFNKSWFSVFPSSIGNLSLDPALEDPSIVPVDAMRRELGYDCYGPLLETLQKRGCYRQLVPEIARSGETRTYTIPESAALNTPDLFIFPYDWRISCTKTAEFLAQYIEAIRKLYPDTELDIVCHSMGGLVSRRYLLTRGAKAPVGRCVTIGTPFHGAPVAYYRLLAGGFFEIGPLDLAADSAIKSVLSTFPGFFELLPSPAYFPRQPYDAFGYVKSDDLGSYSDGFRKRDEIKEFFDGAFAALPVTQNEAFHNVPGQDDWRIKSDARTKYLHVVGVQSFESTTTQVKQSQYAFRDEGGELQTIENAFISKRDFGDHTVPFISAYRDSSLWAPGTVATIARADYPADPGRPIEYDDGHSDHTGLTYNPRVQNALLYFLRSGKRLWSDSLKPPEVPSLAAAAGSRDLLCVGTSDVLAENPEGVKTTDAGEGLRPTYPRDVQCLAGNRSAQLDYSGAGAYTFTIPPQAARTPIPLLQIRSRDAAGETLSTVRFLDVTLPAGSSARLVDRGSAPYLLEIDDDSDGTYDRSISPQFEAAGAATDTTPPLVTARIKKRDGNFYMELLAEDAGAGVSTVEFQHGASPAATYTGEILLDASVKGAVVAFATDNAGNRSALYHFPVDLAANPVFSIAAGNYFGVWANGYLTIALRNTRTFSGSIHLNGVKHPISGAFAADGSLETVASEPDVTVDLHLVQNGGGTAGGHYSISGTVSLSSLLAGSFVAAHATYVKGQTAREAGGYTLFLKGADPSATLPQGTGYAKVTIDKTGGVRLAGKLADGLPFSASSILVGNPTRPEFIINQALNYPLAKPAGAPGLLSGGLRCVTQGESDLHGTLRWVRPGQNSALYPQSFDTRLEAAGSRYKPPVVGQRLFGLGADAPNARIAFTVGGIDAAAIQPAVDFTITAANVASLGFPGSAQNPGSVKLTLDAKQGLFNGTLLLKDPGPGGSTIKRTAAFSGALDSTGRRGSGFFLLPQLPAQGGGSPAPGVLSGNVIIGGK